eukprot:TRINITY_DN1041_c0_g1_i17.p1 TRINITY_DN1041_c0_g1~~TRINITY_DN1041_c0_g1_i17.p1  ORF type:complete len:233 (-),score=37.72 TRINITY_DN1041_c0_g1_i17:418-1116(-)
MSQDSISSELEREILESQAAHQKLLDYSQQPTPLILPDMDQASTFQQACNVPLPAPTPEDMDQDSTTPEETEIWTEEEKEILLDNRKYFEEMISVVDQAAKHGPQKLPKKPKRKLEQLFKEKEGKKKSRKNFTTHQELHDYLVANQADVGTTISRETFTDDLFTKTSDEKEIVDRLQKGVRNLKRQDAQTIMIYIQFGNFLNLCKTWHDGEKKDGRMKKNLVSMAQRKMWIF